MHYFYVQVKVAQITHQSPLRMKNSHTKPIIIIVVLGFIFAFLYHMHVGGGTGPSIKKEPIKIGGISALTGVGVDIGVEEMKGAQLAVAEINAAGGINGHPLELISEDVSLDKLKVAVSVVTKLIHADGVVAIVGPQWDEPAMSILPIIEAAQIPTIGPDNSPMLKAQHEYRFFFSTWVDNRVGIREILRYAQLHNIKDVAILKPIAAGFWEYTAQIMKEEAPRYGVRIVAEENVGNPLVTDFKTSLLKLKQSNPQAIFAVTSDYNQCPFLKQLSQVGFSGVTFGTESSGDPSSLAQCSGLLTRRYFSTPVYAGDRYSKFVAAFKTRYGMEPKYPTSATSYDAVYAVAHGLKASNLRGGEALREAISKLRYAGASQPEISFQENGFVATPENAFEMQVARGGKFVKAE